jgi:hypothetical protein
MRANEDSAHTSSQIKNMQITELKCKSMVKLWIFQHHTITRYGQRYGPGVKEGMCSKYENKF